MRIRLRFNPQYVGKRLRLGLLRVVNAGSSMHCVQGMIRVITVMRQDKDFVFKNLTVGNLNDILVLQGDCVDHLPEPGLYYPLSVEELEESLRRDVVIGVYDGDRLVAVAVIVVNRESPRNLATGIGCSSDQTYTFDAVLVSPGWRGYGLQNILLRQCMEMAEKAGVAYIVATVSPDNHHSLQNFIKVGFEILSTSRKYDGLVRHIIGYSLSNKKTQP